MPCRAPRALAAAVHALDAVELGVAPRGFEHVSELLSMVESGFLNEVLPCLHGLVLKILRRHVSLMGPVHLHDGLQMSVCVCLQFEEC